MTSTEIYTQGAIVAGLLALSAIFSSSETAITSISLAKIRQLKEEDEKKANLLKKIKIKIGDVLATILIGNNIVNIAATAILSNLTMNIDAFKGKYSTLITTFIMTVLVLIFGEITPKSFATQNSLKVASVVARPLDILTIIFKPVLIVLTKITNVLIKLLGGEIAGNNPFVTEEEIRSLVEVGEEEGILEHQEKEMIQNIFEIDDLVVTEVMLPRIDIIAIEDGASIKEALQIITECGHSRIPVYKETIDNIIGVLYAKDLLQYSLSKLDELKIKTIAKLIRPAYYVPETKKANLLLKELQQMQIHMAIVLDEYGGTEGLVTIEDILEVIVGDIFDEYDNEVNLIKKINEKNYLIQADISLEEMNDQFDLNLPEEDFDSLGGYIFSTLGRVPANGDKVEFETIAMEVTKMENRRVILIKLTKKDKIDVENEEE